MSEQDQDSQLPMRGRVALVAGASKGIGAATAEGFAAAGAAVVLAARDTTALKAVADGIEARGGRALAVGTDVTDVGSMRHLVEEALSAFGRLAAHTGLPAVAIGGLTAADFPLLRAAGAAGGAVVSAICRAVLTREITELGELL